jgi:glucan-binding YG repeat protein
MVYGWLKIGGSWYYFGAGGAMVSGRQTIGTGTYTFDDNGVWQG